MIRRQPQDPHGGQFQLVNLWVEWEWSGLDAGMGCFCCFVVGWSGCCLPGWLAGWLAGGLVGRCVGRSVGRSAVLVVRPAGRLTFVCFALFVLPFV